ncbi:hypothetical protein [Sessilibacter sp. MAH4]
MRKFLLILLFSLSSLSFAEYEFEKEKFKENSICPELIGVWFTDVTVKNKFDGLKRDITRLERKANGTAYLKGISIYFQSNEVSDWEFPVKWSCHEGWYVESNEWGYTAFKLVSTGPGENVMHDDRNNLNATTPITFSERNTLDMSDKFLQKAPVKNFLGL